MKEKLYSGYNQLTCDRICDYLDNHNIKYRVRVSNALSAYVRNKTVISVNSMDITDVIRAEIQDIIDSSIEF